MNIFKHILSNRYLRYTAHTNFIQTTTTHNSPASFYLNMQFNAITQCTTKSYNNIYLLNIISAHRTIAYSSSHPTTQTPIVKCMYQASIGEEEHFAVVRATIYEYGTI